MKKRVAKSGSRSGRAPATTHAELSHVALTLFAEKGFENTTVDEIAAAAGVSRRTFFRYFNSKNDLPWGDFDQLLDEMRQFFYSVDPKIPVIEAIRRAVLAFNSFPESESEYHRERMRLILQVPSLLAHSVLRYQAWRDVIADYVAKRLGEDAHNLTPVAIAWACLGLCLGAYEQWVEGEECDLNDTLNEAFKSAEQILGL